MWQGGQNKLEIPAVSKGLTIAIILIHDCVAFLVGHAYTREGCSS